MVVFFVLCYIMSFIIDLYCGVCWIVLQRRQAIFCNNTYSYMTLYNIAIDNALLTYPYNYYCSSSNTNDVAKIIFFENWMVTRWTWPMFLMVNGNKLLIYACCSWNYYIWKKYGTKWNNFRIFSRTIMCMQIHGQYSFIA